MPDNEKNDATVDIDTSGPGAEVELENDSKETETPEVEEKDTSEDKTFENEREVKLEEKKEEPKEAEEKKDKELENYSKDVQRRIAKLTGKWREAERQKEEALYYARSQIKAKEAAEAKISKYEPEFFKNAEDSITSGLQAAQAKLAAAREANDLTAESEALTAISELGYKKAKLQETKVAQEDYNQQKQVKQPDINLARQQAPQVDAGPDPKAEEWASKNAWFGQDTAMTYTAFDLHKKLTEDEGYDPQSNEYYQEIDKRIRLEFPHKFDTNKSDKGEVSTKPVQTVASAKRSTNTGRRTVTLTPSQVAIAKKLGVPLKEYAKQLKITKEV
jgi:DNA repair exonuclease SbcCD ATPase subunit